MKNPVLIIIIILIIAAIVLSVGYFKLGWFQSSIDETKGFEASDTDCGSNKVSAGPINTSTQFIIGTTPEIQCTRPIYDLSNIPQSRELCFSASDLLLKKGDTVPSGKRIGYKTSKMWRLNRQSGDKFCYVYSPNGKYPTM